MDTNVSSPSVTFTLAGARITIPEATIVDLWKERIEVGLLQPPFGPGPLAVGDAVMAGGVYMGIVRGDDGPDYRLFDLGEAENRMPWEEAKKWAAALGGSLPTRREQAVMFGNRGKDQYKAEWYWSNEQCAGTEGYAWVQVFDDGSQDYGRKSGDCHARAVRREPIQ